MQRKLITNHNAVQLHMCVDIKKKLYENKTVMVIIYV